MAILRLDIAIPCAHDFESLSLQNISGVELYMPQILVCMLIETKKRATGREAMASVPVPSAFQKPAISRNL